jgi:hypothetical protein
MSQKRKGWWRWCGGDGKGTAAKPFEPLEIFGWVLSRSNGGRDWSLDLGSFFDNTDGDGDGDDDDKNNNNNGSISPSGSTTQDNALCTLSGSFNVV